MVAASAAREGCEFCDGPLFVDRTRAASTLVAAPPDVLYGLVSDVTRTGEWSPVCRDCWWDEGAGPRVGDWFTGRNETPDRVWETRSQVVAADPGREFAFLVHGKYARWGYTMEPHGDRTVLTESWEFRPAGIELFHNRYGAEAHEQLAERARQASEGIPASLRAIRALAEGSVGAVTG